MLSVFIDNFSKWNAIKIMLVKQNVINMSFQVIEFQTIFWYATQRDQIKFYPDKIVFFSADQLKYVTKLMSKNVFNIINNMKRVQ